MKPPDPFWGYVAAAFVTCLLIQEASSAQPQKVRCLSFWGSCSDDTEKLPGWREKRRNDEPTSGRVQGSVAHIPKPTDSWIETLSWRPRASVYHNFLSPEECNHILNMTRPHVRRSTVIADALDSGKKSELNDIRTSYGVFVPRHMDPIISRLEERISKWTHLPISHQEDFQVLRYVWGQKYGSHWDARPGERSDWAKRNPRVATVLLYLEEKNLQGGETAFTDADADHYVSEALRLKSFSFSECARGKVAVPPKKGDALLFWSLKPDGDLDPYALHAGCPVVDGIKWTATVWIHVNPFRLASFNVPANQDLMGGKNPAHCRDYNQNCKIWAARGECQSRPEYMISDGYNVGDCRKSCNACLDCKAEDYDCQQQNRVKAGFLPLHVALYDP
eukprot:jgi/Botrbrau1/23464/Bobra.106_1s0019.1